VKEFLSRAGKTFTSKNIDDDDGAYRELMAMGIMSVPVTVIGSTRIKGFNQKALAEALNSLDRS
jgi:glutaredoxin-like protein NrdH